MPFLAFMPKTIPWKEQKCNQSLCVLCFGLTSDLLQRQRCAALQDNLGYYDKDSCGLIPTVGGGGLGRLPSNTLSPSPSPICLKPELDCCDRICLSQLMIWPLLPSSHPAPSQPISFNPINRHHVTKQLLLRDDFKILRHSRQITTVV